MSAKLTKEQKKILKFQEKEFPTIKKVQDEIEEILKHQQVLNCDKTDLCETYQGDKICLTGIKSFEN